MTRLYTDWLKANPPKSDGQQAERAYQRQIQAQQAVALRTVVDHAGWQVFVDHLEALLADLERRRSSVALELQNGPAMGPDLDRLKLKLITLAAEAHGLRKARDLIPEILRRAEPSIPNSGPMVGVTLEAGI